MAQNAPYDIFVLDFNNVDALDFDFYASIQQRLARVGEEFSTFAQSLWGKQASNFLDSSPGFDQMDDSWEPIRILGKGSFGLVGLWQKTGRKGEVKDQVAIKEMASHPDDELSLDRDSRLAREAVIMKQLNDAERLEFGTNSNILRLRSFKNFPSAGRWRFYLEYAYGDLYKLINSYRAWNTHLPEEFLWHVFNSLAKAAVVMEKGPFTNLESQDPTKWSITHFDIKPENTYLGKPDKDGLCPSYPTIKVADFGLAQMTGQSDQRNPRLFRRKGTEGCQPPEQTCFTVGWDQRPDGTPFVLPKDRTQELIDNSKNREERMRNPGYKFLSAHNVWGLGKLMYDLLKLAYWYGLDDGMRSTTEELYYQEYDQHAIPEITTRKKPEYSTTLRELVRECLHIEIRKRPTPDQLLARTREGLETAMRSRRRNADESNNAEVSKNPPRVYYMGSEINHMPIGDAEIRMGRDEWREFRGDLWPDPAWQPLLSARWAPEVQKGLLVNHPVVEGGPTRQRPWLDATVRRDPQPLLGNPRGVIWTPRSSPSRGDAQRIDGVGGDDDHQREAQYQHELGQRVRDSGPHDTQKINSSPNNSNTTRRPDAFEAARARQERAVDHLAALAGDMPHPPAVPSGPKRVKLNPPKPPPKQQPQRRQRRRRAMDLSIDDDFREAEGHFIEGHNLRKRPRRSR